MMLATNWGIYEICERHVEFIEPGDPRTMEIRTRDRKHIKELRKRYPGLIGETIALTDGTADFPYRVFITRADLTGVLAGLVYEIDYVQFKKDAKDPIVHRVLNSMWSTWLNAYPKFSKWNATTLLRPTIERRRKNWWDDL